MSRSLALQGEVELSLAEASPGKVKVKVTMLGVTGIESLVLLTGQ